MKFFDNYRQRKKFRKEYNDIIERYKNIIIFLQGKEVRIQYFKENEKKMVEATGRLVKVEGENIFIRFDDEIEKILITNISLLEEQ